MNDFFYFGFDFNQINEWNDPIIGNIAALTPNKTSEKFVMFLEYDQENNMVIHYENDEEWGYEIMPKKVCLNKYLGYRKEGYVPMELGV